MARTGSSFVPVRRAELNRQRSAKPGRQRPAGCRSALAQRHRRKRKRPGHANAVTHGSQHAAHPERRTLGRPGRRNRDPKHRRVQTGGPWAGPRPDALPWMWPKYE